MQVKKSYALKWIRNIRQVRVYVMVWFFFRFNFFKPVWIFQNGLNFSNQIGFFCQLSIKKGKCHFTFLCSILSYSCWVPADLFYLPATLPFPPKSPLGWILINGRFHFFSFYLILTGIWTANLWISFHCHYQLTMKAMDARALILVLIISSSPQAPLV